jgi:hypothetical protein
MQFGCEKPSQMAVGEQLFDMPITVLTVDGQEIKLFRHPDLLIMESLSLWLDDFFYCEKYGRQAKYEENHPCWIEASSLFRQHLRGFQKNGR